MLRNAFRGKPIGPLRPRSSGIKADDNKARFAPRVLSIGIEMHVALLALRLLQPRSRLGSRPFCCGSNMNVVLMSRWTVVFFGERRILPTVYLVCQLKRKRALVIV